LWPEQISAPVVRPRSPTAADRVDVTESSEFGAICSQPPEPHAPRRCPDQSRSAAAPRGDAHIESGAGLLARRLAGFRTRPPKRRLGRGGFSALALLACASSTAMRRSRGAIAVTSITKFRLIYGSDRKWRRKFHLPCFAERWSWGGSSQKGLNSREFSRPYSFNSNRPSQVATYASSAPLRSAPPRE
jgi:hypothetical protein